MEKAGTDRMAEEEEEEEEDERITDAVPEERRKTAKRGKGGEVAKSPDYPRTVL